MHSNPLEVATLYSCNPLCQIAVKRVRRKRKVERIVRQNRASGQIGNLKGSVFNLACQINIHQKYPFLFRFGPIPTYVKRIGTTVMETVAYACENEEVFEGLSSLFPRSNPLWSEERYDWRLRAKKGKAKRSGSPKQMSDSTERKVNRILKREAEYRSLRRKFPSNPDFVVFTRSEIHIFEFKFSGQVGSTKGQREFARFLRGKENMKTPSIGVPHVSKALHLEDFVEDSAKKRETKQAGAERINVRLFVLRPTEDFLKNVRIECHEV